MILQIALNDNRYMKPIVRIKGYEKDWISCLLSDCLTICNERNHQLQYGKKDALSVSDEYGVVNQIQHLGRSYAGKDVSGYKILRKNQIVYTKSPLKQKPYGIIKVNDNEDGIVSVLYAVYDTKNDICPDFLNRYFEPHGRINKYLIPIISKGAKNTINVSDAQALQGRINIPVSEDEQKAIAGFFSDLDKLIVASTNRVSSLRKMKAASLQAMFPQKGETMPIVRFKGFEGDWETGKLSKFATRITRKNKNLETTLPITISAAEGLVAQDSFFNNIVASPNLRGYYLVKRGEFAYNKSYSSNYPFGAVKRLEKYDRGALSILYIVFTLNENISSDYIVHFFDTSLWHNEVAMRAAEGARNHGLLNIGAEDFLDIDIVYPKSIDEQNEIAKYFTTLDKQISLEEQKLESLKRIKSACLDKMFV